MEKPGWTTSPYRQPALTILTRCIEAGTRLLAACLLLQLPTVAAETGTSPPAVLRAYTADYKTTARGFELTVTRTLESADGRHYVLTNEGSMLVVGYHEISVFTVVNDGEIQPVSYVYQGSGLVNRRRELHFFPAQQRIASLYKGETYELPYQGRVLDRMNQLEQLRLALLLNPEAPAKLGWPVADRKRVKDSPLVLIGTETLQTPLGAVPTVHYERLHSDPQRTSHIWLAPEWDYLMVRTVHVEDGDPVEMTLTSAAIDGTPVVLE
jgi:hypothetical protein